MNSKRHFLIELWELTQVELHGRYSSNRVIALENYARETSAVRAIGVMLATPLPCLIVTVLIDLLPLPDPSEEIRENKLFFVRQYYSFLLMTFIAMHQIRIGIPALSYTTRSVVQDTVLVSTLNLSILYALILMVGFPLPFTILTMMPVWATLSSTCMAIRWRTRLRKNPEARSKLFGIFKLWMYEILMVFIYPSYFYVFKTLSSTVQAAFSLLLPVIKIMMRNLLAKTTTNARDNIPLLVVFNADVFSSLFLSYCIQTSPTFRTTMGLMLTDITILGLSLRDIEIARTGLQDLEVLVDDECIWDLDQTFGKEMNSENCRLDALRRTSILLRKHECPEITETSSILLHDGSAEADPILQNIVDEVFLESDGNDNTFTITPSSLIVAKQLWSTGRTYPITKAIEHKSRGVSTKLAYTLKVQRLLYMAEFLLLLNFVEVIIPLVFSIYLIVTYNLPNRTYYRVFDGMDEELLPQTLKNVMFYCLLQLLSLLGLILILKRMLGHSPMRHISFVLENQLDYVQMSLVFWLFYNAQSTLQHTGFDYSFQFAWLSGNPDSP